MQLRSTNKEALWIRYDTVLTKSAYTQISPVVFNQGELQDKSKSSRDD